MSYLLDTNVLSEMIRPEPAAAVGRWVTERPERSFYISVITWGELKRGITALPDGKRKAQLAGWLEDDIAIRFGERLLPIDKAVANRWGNLAAVAKAEGNNVKPLDIYIAATSLVHDLTVVTRNTKDFEPLGVRVFNPWAA